MGKIPVIKRDGKVVHIDQNSLKIFPENFSTSQKVEKSFYLDGFKIESFGKKYRVEIMLKSSDGERLSGRSEGAGTEKNLPRLVGEAVVDAFKAEEDVSIDDIKKVSLARKEFVFVHLTFFRDGREQWKIGISLLERDFLSSVISSVIDALVNIVQ
ncbi:hypothetical protein [Thermotoga sp.]|uniref:hypothetical protein n=1 Tax=Thermotoga sp. TaxID=28240 RepID=UPI0025EB90AA|nr:hypothetical protein [Thermotoga sp.]MCD6551840.1 hypothetical protein [Thermotoga sp.]